MSVGNLDRVEAVRILKEIIASTCCDSNFVALMRPNAYNLLSKGYQIHIKTTIDVNQKDKVDSILEKNGLVLKEDRETLIIYKPVGK